MSKSAGYTQMPSDPRYAPPSYREMGQPKPKSKHADRKEPHFDHRPLPVHDIECSKCHGLGGQLVKIDPKTYAHPECLIAQ